MSSPPGSPAEPRGPIQVYHRTLRALVMALAYVACASLMVMVLVTSTEVVLRIFRLTLTGGNVYDYAVSPDGEQVIFSARNAEKGYDLWETDREGSQSKQILPCGADWCDNPAYSADGQQVAYSRRVASGLTGAGPGMPRLWLLDRQFIRCTTLEDFILKWSRTYKLLTAYMIGGRANCALFHSCCDIYYSKGSQWPIHWTN